jgi:uncharacterized protein (TIGR02246 family)
MKSFVMAAALACAAFPMAQAAFAQSQNAQPMSAEEARKTAEEGAAGWMSTYQQHDAKAIAAFFLPDAVFMPPDGSPMVKGREALERQWAQQFQELGGREELMVRDAVPAGSDAIVALVDWAITADQGANAGKTIRGRTANTLVRTPEGWRIAVIAPQFERAPATGVGSSTPPGK